MKKISLIVLFIIINISMYSQQKWMDIAVTENEEIYVDTSQIQYKNGIIKAIIKTVYTTPQAKSNYVNNIKKAFSKKADEKIRKWNDFSYNISYRIYDCENKQYKTLQIADHNSDGSIIVKTKANKKKIKWIPVDIDTVADHVLFYLCDNETR